LRRADILILNHKNELNDADELTTRLKFEFRHLQVYTAQYNFRKLTDINGNEISLETIKNKKLAALTGTGYPQGFFNKLEQSDVRIFRKIIYPDHYTLNADELKFCRTISSKTVFIMLLLPQKINIICRNQAQS
jgi:tetraacyldisaccharide-1-P 4'-kinase